MSAPIKPVLLGCRDLSKAFGVTPLFEGLSFSIHEGDHIGLVGPNGAGKSTLLRILAGRETADEGSSIPRKNLRVGYMPQHPEFPPGASCETVVREALEGCGLDDHDGDQHVAVALSRTGFNDAEVDPETLSGGWRARLALARAIVVKPDLLLLDEPTNHLDIESILWLESFLRNQKVAFVVVSHDRYFLQNVARRMLDIDRVYPEGLLSVDGPYADLLEKRDSLLSQQASYRESLSNRVRREIAWLRRGAKARTSKSKSRLDAAHRSIEELEHSRRRSEATNIGVDLTSSGRKTKRLWAARGVAKSYGHTRHHENEAIAHLFEASDDAALADSVTDFLSQAFGGDVEYTGRDMVSTHEGMGLTDDYFLAAGADVQAALEAAGVGDDEIQEVMCAFASLHGEVVARAL